MICPVCKTNLVANERQGVEIDFCPQCKGVWLDRGELEKIIERTAGYGDDSSSAGHGGSGQHGGSGHGGSVGGHGGKRRRGGFLGELFDF